jgi:hypothetical protein
MLSGNESVEVFLDRSKIKMIFIDGYNPSITMLVAFVLIP